MIRLHKRTEDGEIVGQVAQRSAVNSFEVGDGVIQTWTNLEAEASDTKA